jgi:hypothetical protein
MSIVLVGSTSGSITLQEPAVAGTTVLTLPAVTGTILTTTSPKAGNVIQVVTNTTNAQVSTSSTSFVSATLAVSITPSSTSSKVFVMVASTSQGSTTNSMYYTIYRGATNLGSTLGMTAFTNGNGNQFPFSMSYLDSPSTTSSTTYTVYFRTSSGSVFMGENNMVTSITAMEIKG